MLFLKTLLRFYDTHIRPPLFRFRTWWPFWFWILNQKPRKLFSLHQTELSPTEKRIVEDLQRDGIASSSLEELFGSEFTLKELYAYTQALPLIPSNQKQSKKDEFMRRLWPVRIALNFENPFLRLSLHPTVIDIVSAYMQMWVKLKYYDLSETIPVSHAAPAQYSQQWHRDPEEKRLIKMFIYLTDVDESAGPFIYIPQSVFGLRWGHLFPQCPPAGSYPSEKDVDQSIPSSAKKMMIGKAGTVIFCDTSGLHRGGYSEKKPRIMFTASFTAPSSRQEVWYWQDDEVTSRDNLTPATRYAITHPASLKPQKSFP